MAKKMAKYFITVAVLFFIVGCLEGIMFPTKFRFQSFYAAVMHIPPEHLKSFFSHFVVKIHTHISLIGWVSSALMGILYFIVPQIKDQAKDQTKDQAESRERYSKWACYANFWLHVFGILLFCAGFHLIGMTGLKSGYAPGSPEFRELEAPFKVIVLTGGSFICLSSLPFSFNITRTLFAKETSALKTMD